MLHSMDTTQAQCPICSCVFGLPTKRHPISVVVACPCCRGRLVVLLHVRGTQRAKRAPIETNRNQ